jgi:hypothetical protein
MSVRIEKSDLGRRRQHLLDGLRQLCRGARPNLHQISKRNSTVLLLSKDPTNDIRRVRFPTRVDRIYMNFFEAWHHSDNSLILDKSYFHIYHADESGSEEECAAIHFAAVAKTDSIYEKHPHIHFSTLGFGFNKSHIALSLLDNPDAFLTYNKFKKSFNKSVSMINNELLGRVDL